MKLMMQVLGSLTERNLVRFFGLPRPPASSGGGDLSPWTWILKLDQNTRRGSDAAGALEAAIQSECFSLLGLRCVGIGLPRDTRCGSWRRCSTLLGSS